MPANAVCLINSRGAVKWPGDVLRRLPRLKMITVCGIGTDAIDLEAARELGIVVCNLPGQTAPIVAEHALGLMLAVARRAWFQTNELKSGAGRRGTTSTCAARRSAWSAPAASPRRWPGWARPSAWTCWRGPSTRRRSGRPDLGVTFVSLEELLSRSDVVSLHVKLTERKPRPHRRGADPPDEAGAMLDQHGPRPRRRQRRPWSRP